MDVIGGLTAARLALNLAKDLREIDKSIDEATYKMKLAELMSALADAQVALSDAKTRQAQLEDEIVELKHGNLCPKCREGRLKVVDVRAAGMSMNAEFHDVSCSNDGCDYKSTRTFNRDSGKYRGT